MLRKSKSFFVWLAAAVAAVALRLITMIVFTDYATGFIKPEYFSAAVILFAVFLCITVFATLYVSISAANAKTTPSFYLTNSVFALAVGVTIAISAFWGDYANVPDALRIVCIALGIISAFFFCGFAFRSVFHFPFSEKLTVFPLAFFIIKSAVVFIKNSYHTAIIDTVFEVGSYCLILLLFLEIARVANNAATKNAVNKFSALSASASIFLISASLPKLLLAITYPSALHDGTGDSLLLLFLGFFVVSLLFTRLDFAEKEDRKMGVYYVGKH